MCALVTGVQTCDLPILRDGKLSLGVLDPLIEELRKRPPRPDAAKPRIVVDDGTLLLTTDYGATRLTTDATVADGKLMALCATSGPTSLEGRRFAASLGPGADRKSTRLNPIH